MGASAETTNFLSQQQYPVAMLPPRQQPRPTGLRTSLSLSDACGSPDLQEPPGSNSEQVRESPTESASSRETWPAGKRVENEKEGENDVLERPVIRRVSCSDKISLRDIARERVEIISERMILLPEEIMEELKAELRVILEGTGGSQHREEFLVLQKLVQNRVDLTAKALSRAHRVQLEVLVAINTGIQAFLHPNICLSQTSLMEVFLYKRCRNIACQNQIPADDCTCDVCSNRNGFCNHCMCVICNKFDFEVNTCRWIGCDLCSHWTHTDCAIREGQVVMGPCVKSGGNPPEMLFRCRACNRTSELLGWVKDVFQHCAPGWDREALVRELDVVSRIFRGSEDPRGRKMFWKCEELIEKMKSGVSESTTYKVMLMFFQEKSERKDVQGESVDQLKGSDGEPNSGAYKFREYICGEEAMRIPPSKPYCLRCPIRRGHLNISQHYSMQQEFERSRCQPIKSPNLVEKFRLQGGKKDEVPVSLIYRLHNLYSKGLPFAGPISTLRTNEAELVQAVLQMLQGFSSSLFYWDDDSFCPKTGIYLEHVSQTSLTCMHCY